MNLVDGDSVNHPWYDKEGDILTVFVSEKESYSDTINGSLSVFRSFDTNEITGFCLRHVSRLVSGDKNIDPDNIPSYTPEKGPLSSVLDEDIIVGKKESFWNWLLFWR